MSRDKNYQRLLNDKRWWGEGGVKVQVWRRAGAVCEQCKEEGIITGSLQSQLDCHHIIPVETGRTIQEMERLCYDVNNIRLLCVEHHIKVHQEMRTHTKEKVAENKARARQRFMELNDPNYKPQDNDNTGTQGATTVDAHTEDRPLAGSDRPIPEPIGR